MSIKQSLLDDYIVRSSFHNPYGPGALPIFKDWNNKFNLSTTHGRGVNNNNVDFARIIIVTFKAIDIVCLP